MASENQTGATTAHSFLPIASTILSSSDLAVKDNVATEDISYHTLNTSLH